MSDIEMVRAELLTRPVEDFEVSHEMSVCELIEAYRRSHGFMASHVARASEILAEMAREADLRILAFTGNLLATGLRGVIVQLLREGLFNAVITTCGAIDHDIARGTGAAYYAGDWNYDDGMLRALEIHRLGNVLIPVENYGLAIEKFVRPIFEELSKVKKKWSGYELLWEIGKRIKSERSLLRTAYEKSIPVFVPGIYDGSFGSQIVFNHAATGLEVDIIADEKKIIEMVFAANKLGALIVGGGISKHHTIWWAQMREGLDYAIYVTTASEYDGSLSGAQPREAISWGKLKPTAKNVTVYGDATVVLPLVVAGALCELGKRA